MATTTRSFTAMAGTNLPAVIERPPVMKPEVKKPEVEPPQRYMVMIHDDDSTPHEIVLKVLQEKFAKGPSDAFNIMLAAEAEGKAPVVTLPRELAEAKAEQATNYARSIPHPVPGMDVVLTFTAEPL